MEPKRESSLVEKEGEPIAGISELRLSIDQKSRLAVLEAVFALGPEPEAVPESGPKKTSFDSKMGVSKAEVR